MSPDAESGIGSGSGSPLKNDSSGSPLQGAALLLPLKGFFLSLSFLSRIPSPFPDAWADSRALSWSFAFHPLSGAVMGALAALPAFVLWSLSPGIDNIMSVFLFLASFVYVTLLEWLSRFLHFDGLCDCADAFSTMTASPERRLEIMKDPHVGASAVAAGALLIAGKVLAMYLVMVREVLMFDGFIGAFSVMVAIPALARLSMVALAAMGRYPRESGCAAHIVGKVPPAAVAFALVSVIPAGLLLGFYSIVLAMLICGFSVIYWEIMSKVKIGGVTGDVLGACCETSELGAMAGFLVALSFPH